MATTVPGGYYLRADGVAVDANGKPVEAKPEAEVKPEATKAEADDKKSAKRKA